MDKEEDKGIDRSLLDGSGLEDPDDSGINLEGEGASLDKRVSSSLYGREDVGDDSLAASVESEVSMGDTQVALPRDLPRRRLRRRPMRVRRKNIIREANLSFRGPKRGNIEDRVSSFMKKVVFNDDNFDYGGLDKLGKIIDYFARQSESVDGNAKQTLESVRTILLHLNDYLTGERNGSFKQYLFGEDGKLTQRRLSDMKVVTKGLSEYKGRIKSGKNYVFSNGDGDGENFNVFNVSYSSHESGKSLVNINDDNSKGMYTDHGKLYWGSLDQMFDGVNTRKTVTHHMKKSVSNSIVRRDAERVSGYDWKKKRNMVYAWFKR